MTRKELKDYCPPLSMTIVDENALITFKVDDWKIKEYGVEVFWQGKPYNVLEKSPFNFIPFDKIRKIETNEYSFFKRKESYSGTW